MQPATPRSSVINFNVPMPEELHSMLSVIALMGGRTRRQQAAVAVRRYVLAMGERWAKLEGIPVREWWKRELTDYLRQLDRPERPERRRRLAVRGLTGLEDFDVEGVNGAMGKEAGE